MFRNSRDGTGRIHRVHCYLTKWRLTATAGIIRTSPHGSDAASDGWAEHVRSALRVQTSTYPAIASASYPLAPRAGEPVLTKTSHNAFTTTGLQQLLTQRGITELAVCGIRTEQCCETTARVASDLGYEVAFVTEATATNPIPHRDAPAGQSVEELLADPRTLPASAVIERTEYALAGRFATIATIEEVLCRPAALTRS